jgi:hypothetical protein
MTTVPMTSSANSRPRVVRTPILARFASGPRDSLMLRRSDNVTVITAVRLNGCQHSGKPMLVRVTRRFGLVPI